MDSVAVPITEAPVVTACINVSTAIRAPALTVHVVGVPGAAHGDIACEAGNYAAVGLTLQFLMPQILSLQCLHV